MLADHLDQWLDLVLLAAEANKKDTGKVGILGVADHGAAQDVHALAHRIEPAAQGMRQRDHAIDIRVSGQALRVEVAGNCAGHGSRTIHRGDHGDVIARTDLAIRAHVAFEAGRLGKLGRIEFRRADGIVALELTHAKVVRMDVLACGDVLLGKADDLVVAVHGFAGFDVMRSQLVARGDQIAYRQFFRFDKRPRQQLLGGDQHVVIGMQTDD